MRAMVRSLRTPDLEKLYNPSREAYEDELGEDDDNELV